MMQRPFLLVLALLFVSAQLSAQLKPDILKLAGTEHDGASVEDMVVLENGTTVILGTKFVKEYSNRGFIAWIDPAGNLIKEHLLGSISESGACSLDVALPEPGTNHLYVSGMAQMWTGKYAGREVGDDDAMLIKFDERGNELWMKKWALPNRNGIEGLAFDPKGNVVMASFQNTDDYEVEQMRMVTLSPSGQELSYTPIPFPYRSIRSNCRFKSAGDGSYWFLFFGKQDPATNKKVKLHLMRVAGNGQVLAEHIFTGNAGTMIDDLVPLQSGGVLVAFRSYGSSGEFPRQGNYLFRFDHNANLQWTKIFSGDDPDQPHMVVTETDKGNIYAAIYIPGLIPKFSDTPRWRTNLYLVKLTAEGEELSHSNILALDYHQEGKGIELINGDLYLAIEGNTRTMARQDRYLNSWFCVLKDIQ